MGNCCGGDNTEHDKKKETKKREEHERKEEKHEVKKVTEHEVKKVTEHDVKEEIKEIFRCSIACAKLPELRNPFAQIPLYLSVYIFCA